VPLTWKIECLLIVSITVALPHWTRCAVNLRGEEHPEAQGSSEKSARYKGSSEKSADTKAACHELWTTVEVLQHDAGGVCCGRIHDRLYANAPVYLE
jgi:hypothetical protein